MRIFAHRGVSAHYPENSLAAFARAVGLRTHGIELDVRLSRDGVPVVIHDSTVDRTSNGIGSVQDFTAKQLGLLDVGHRQHVPTLSQVLALAAGKVRVNVEIKEADAVASILQTAGAFRDLDWFASSTDWQALSLVKELSPETDCYPLTLGLDHEFEQALPLQSAIDLATAWGSSGLSIWERSVDESVVELLHSKGQQVWAWTVNEPERAQQLAKMGVDAVCTDDPELIRNCLYASVVDA